MSLTGSPDCCPSCSKRKTVCRYVLSTLLHISLLTSLGLGPLLKLLAVLFVCLFSPFYFFIYFLISLWKPSPPSHRISCVSSSGGWDPMVPRYNFCSHVTSVGIPIFFFIDPHTYCPSHRDLISPSCFLFHCLRNKGRLIFQCTAWILSLTGKIYRSFSHKYMLREE